MRETRITLKNVVLGLQHLVAMSGATILVPLITGLSASVALFTAGVGTLIFHLVTKGKVPVFLGSSFAFIGVITIVGAQYGLEYATGGIVAAGLVYLLFALIVKLIGTERVKKLFPPVVTGSMIMVIGLTLAPVVINSNILEAPGGTAGQRWLVAFSVAATMVIVSIFVKGFFKLTPILFGFIVGYLVSLPLGLVDTAAIAGAAWFKIPQFMLPKFNLEAIIVISSVTIVTFMEHIGDITTNGAVTKNDFFKDPGLAKTLIGDGLATSFAGLVGGPANTTYSENTGVLAMTGNFNPFTLEVAAVFAIILAFFGKLGVALQTIPAPVIGGASIILFGMIATIGLRTIKDGDVDLNQNRNLIIISIMLVLGISGVTLPITGNIGLSGLSLSALTGIILNLVLPNSD
ncbi:MAG TPA: uracil-xanthine permease [Firmicutes bacterium]|nr:uracil-xanthine permease [Bacillota bacterium]